MMITRNCAIRSMDVLNFSLNKCLMRLEAECVFSHMVHCDCVPNKPNPREVEIQIKCVSICSRESVEMVEKIAVELNKVENDYMLYTPTLAVADYENCSRSTLTCFALELNVLFVEIQSVDKLSQKLLRLLNNLKYKFQDKMKSCPDCELYQEQKAETFLEELQNFLQMMNAGKRCAPRNVKRHLENLMEKT
ncbi:interleukin 15, like isoform X2 [Siphateles boraxobius]|uniref:interleukin 15, like isoform X2 n=2 Tax=Siphateles boraxobius TaxID=180520 RepID=UPI004062E635